MSAKKRSFFTSTGGGAKAGGGKRVNKSKAIFSTALAPRHPHGHSNPHQQQSQQHHQQQRFALTAGPGGPTSASSLMSRSSSHLVSHSPGGSHKLMKQLTTMKQYYVSNENKMSQSGDEKESMVRAARGA